MNMTPRLKRWRGNRVTLARMAGLAAFLVLTAMTLGPARR